MEDHPNAALFRRHFAGPPEAYAEAIDDDVEWWEIGKAEPIIGKEALMARMQEQAGLWEIDGQLHDVVANDEHVVALIEATGKRGDRTLDYRVAEIYHVRDGKVTHRWAFSDDTAAIADFFS
jgi:ketosteroid isomerase-like protein